MSKAKADRRLLKNLWPLAVAVLAACGGGADPSATDAAQQAADMESAQGYRSSSWVSCANEGSVCTFTDTRVVRYGLSGSYVYKTATKSIPCTNQAFGSDPAYGKNKYCAYSTNTATTSSTTTTTAPTAKLTWTAPTQGTAVSYRVYYGTAPRTYLQSLGSGISAGANTSYTVQNLTAGTTYYFAVTAVDAVGKESGYSVEAKKVAQ